MTDTRAPEQRTVDVDVTDLDAQGRRISGFAAMYGIESRDLGGFTETISPGAFRDVLAAEPDVYLTFNHSPDKVLARTTSGTLRLRDEDRGLAFEADLGDGPTAQDVRDMVRRGDVAGASFRFVVAADGERWEGDRRTLTRIGELVDLSLATTPAYDGPTVEIRSRNPEPAAKRQEDKMDENRTGGLAVEDRAAAAEPSIEDRVRDAFLSVRKGESRSLTTTSAAAIAPPELSSYLFDRLRPASALLASGVQVVATDRDQVTWPRLTADVAAAFYNEAQAITPSDPTLVSLTATPRKLATLTQLSNEVIDDSEPPVVDVLQSHVARVLALKLDISAFEGSGTAPEIRGLKNVVGIQTVSAGANGAALTNLDLIADAIGLLDSANANANAIVMPPRTWNGIRKLKDTQNRPLVGSGSDEAPNRLFGIPVYVTSSLSVTETQGTSTDASSVYVYDAGQVVLVRRQDATIEVDRSRLFNQDMSELRGKLRADLVVPNPSAVVRVAGVR